MARIIAWYLRRQSNFIRENKLAQVTARFSTSWKQAIVSGNYDGVVMNKQRAVHLKRIQDHFPPLMKRTSVISDAELLATFRRQRDEASFREIVLRHGRMVQLAARQVLGNQSDSEDIVQATFLTLIQRPSSIKRGQSLGSWLYGVAHRLALQHQRSTSRRLRREQQSEPRRLDETTRSVATAELKAEISHALEAIPERYRQAIIYCYLEERSPETAAKLLGCPVGTLWSRLARGREKLRTILAKRGWNLELPAIALVLSATEGSVQAGAHLWRQLQNLVHWQPQATILTPLNPVLAGLLLKEKVMFSLRSVMSVVVFVGLLACGAGLSINALAQTSSESGRLPLAAKVPQAAIDIKPMNHPADWKGRLRGTITAADTGKPLAGATIRVGLAGVPEEYRSIQATSGADGKYSLVVPVGHLWLSGLFSPPGYYTKDAKTHGQVAVKEGEDAVFDFKLDPGLTWNVQYADGPASAKKPPQFISSPDVQPGTMMSSASILMAIGDLQGKGILTFPRESERYRITSYWPESGLTRGATALLDFDGGFDSQQIAGQPQAINDGKGQRIIDRAGRVATVEDAEFVVEGQTVTIRMKQKPESREPNLVFQGKVLDQQNKPIEGAEAIMAFHSHSSGAMSEFTAKTNAEGVFKMDGLNRADTRAQQAETVNVMIRKKGYESKESKMLQLEAVREKGNGEFGTVILGTGLTLRGRVFDKDGKPVHGAVVMNMTNYFLYSHLQCRTDAEGRFSMSGLAEGKHSLEVQYGTQVAYSSHDVGPKSDELKIVVQPRRESDEELNPLKGSK